VRLLDDDYDQRLSVHLPDPQRLHMVTERYSTIVHSLHRFLLAGVRKDWHGSPGRSLNRSNTINQRHIGSLVTAKLFPTKVQAGHIRDIQTEAIARSEIESSYIRKATESSGYLADEDSELHEVYLRTSAAAYAGTKPLGFTACYSIISLDRVTANNSKVVITPRYMGVAINRTDQPAQAAVAESRAAASRAVAWSDRNLSLQNIRHSRTRHNVTDG